MSWLVERRSAAISLLVGALYTAYVISVLAIPTETEVNEHKLTVLGQVRLHILYHLLMNMELLR